MKKNNKVAEMPKKNGAPKISSEDAVKLLQATLARNTAADNLRKTHEAAQQAQMKLNTLAESIVKSAGLDPKEHLIDLDKLTFTKRPEPQPHLIRPERKRT